MAVAEVPEVEVELAVVESVPTREPVLELPLGVDMAEETVMPTAAVLSLAVASVVPMEASLLLVRLQVEDQQTTSSSRVHRCLGRSPHLLMTKVWHR